MVYGLDTVGGYAKEERWFEFSFKIHGNVSAVRDKLSEIDALGLFAANNDHVVDEIVVKYKDGTDTAFKLHGLAE